MSFDARKDDFGNYWSYDQQHPGNVAYFMYKVRYADGTVDTFFMLANSKAMEMLGVDSEGNLFIQGGYPNHLVDEKFNIYNMILQPSNIFYGPGSNMWYGFHAEAKMLAFTLDLYLIEGTNDLRKRITEFESYIASEKGFCQAHCYASMLNVKDFFQEENVNINIFLRNEYSPSSNSYEEDGALTYQYLFFLNDITREINQPRSENN